MKKNIDKKLTTGQVATELGVEPRTIERWRKAKKLVPESKTFGGHYRYSQKQIKDFQDKCNKKQNKPLKTNRETVSKLQDLLD